MKVIFVIYLFILIANVNSLQCGEEEFACNDDLRCISINYVCNDYANCLDESDEDPKLCEDWEYDYNFDDEDYEGKEFFNLFGLNEITKQLDLNDEKSDEDMEDDSYQSKEDSREQTILDTFGEKDDNPELCSLITCDPSGVLSLRTGHQYKYAYNMEIVTEASSQNRQQAKVEMSSNITLLGLSACEFSMKVSSVEKFTSEKNSYGNPIKKIVNSNFEHQLMKNELRFSMHGGVVNYICPKDDDVKILNFKKGIISMIQNSMTALYLSHSVIEKDINGECPTRYSYLDAEDSSTIISRTKDLSNCKERSYLHSSTNGISYEFPGSMQSLPVINSTNSCQQKIRKGIIQSVNCLETHALIPFTSDSTSISTTIKQNLDLFDEKYAIAHIGKIFSRTEILFDHKGSTNNGEEFYSDNMKENIVEVLKTYLNTIQNGDNTKHIGTVIRIFKMFALSDFELIKSDKLWNMHRNILHDALCFVNTQASVTFMVQEMNIFVPKLHLKWMRSFDKSPSPDLKMVEEVVKLLDNEQLPPEIYLHIGTYIHSYCFRHRECKFNPVIYNAIKKFEIIITNKCYKKSSEDKMNIIMALKGIGNAGIAVTESLLEALSACFLNEEIGEEIRATAITAFRRIDCSVSRKNLEMMFADNRLDSELRILAYVEIMRCPNYRVIKLVRSILSIEEVNQVGSFVWTHLANLKESGMPSKLFVQSLLSNKELAEKFNPDVRKFSRFIEWSAYYDELNMGASLESSIMFSQKSYIPRVATFNLTADLFGKSFNFFELGARMKGFDIYIEEYLIGKPYGKNNSIRNKKITDLISMNSRGDQYLEDEAELSLNMKTFGNEVYYKQYDGMDELNLLLKSFNPEYLLNSIREGKEFKIQSSTMPMSGIYYLATCAGLSLGINLDIIASVDISAEIEADIEKLYLTNSGVVRGKLQPSLDVDVLASMTVDTITSKSGVEFNGKLHSSISINGKAEVDGYKILKLDINLPKETIEVFDVSAKLMLIHERSGGSAENSILTRETIGNNENLSHFLEKEENTPPSCTNFHQEIGIEFCYVWNFPRSNSSFSAISLLNGPLRILAAVKKKETDLISYKFRYQWEHTDEKISLLFLLDTPGTAISREHKAIFALNYSERTAHFVIKSPKHNIALKGKYIWKPNEKRFDSTIRINDKSGTAILGYKIASKTKQSTLLPSVRIVWDAKEIFKIGGSLEAILRKSSGKSDSVYYAVDVVYNIDIGGKFDGKITGHVNVKQYEWEIFLDIPYSTEEKRSGNNKEQIHIEYSDIRKITQSVNKYDRNWKITFTQFPNLNTKGRLTSKKYFGLMENELQIGFGTGYQEVENQVTLYQKLVFLAQNDHSTFNSTIAIKYPKKNLDLKLGIDYYRDRKDTNAGFEFQYTSGRSVRSRFHILTISSDPLNTVVDFHLIIPDLTNFLFHISIKEVNENVYQFALKASLSEATRIKIEGLYSDHSTNMNSLYNLALKIKIPQREMIHVNSTILQNQKEIAFLGQLTLTSGYPYTLRVAYIKEKDDLLVLERRLEIDFQLPQRLYYWHAKYSIGDFITISNVIHVDTYRDIILWIQMPVDTEKLKSLEVKFYWDANRDPHKKAMAKVILTDQLFNYSASASFMGNDYKTFWTASKNISHNDAFSIYKYKTEGFITWKDSNKVLHEFSSGLSFDLKRGSTAELLYKGFLITPFNGWEDNWFKLEYARNSSRVSASLLSKWHEDEFINMQAHSSKMVLQEGWNVESILDVGSSIEGLVTVKMEGSIQVIRRKIIMEGLVKWETDILEFILQGENNSGADDIRLALHTKTTTTLPGFALMKANFEFMTAEGILDIYSAIQLEEALYKLKIKGLVFAMDEYLRVEVRLSSPDCVDDTGVIFLRAFKDPNGVHDKLDIVAKWYSNEINLKGEMASLPDDFEVQLAVVTPFAILKQGSISAGHKRQQTYKTQVKAQWNEIYTVGFLVDAYFNSLLDFLLNVELETPFSQFQVIKGEIKNEFKINSDAFIYSRIFTQLNKNKFGIGGRLEQGAKSRLRVGLELYTPSPDLEEVYFDMAYNLTSFGKSFTLSMGHGKDQHINLLFKMKHTDQSLEMALDSDVEVPMLGDEYGKMSIDFGGKLFWMTSRDLSVNLLAATISRTFKFATTASMFPSGGGTINGLLDFPYELLRNLDYFGEYQLSPYPNEGYAEVKLIQYSNTLFEFTIKGNVRDLAISVLLPFPVLRNANVQYEMVAYDIKRSKFKAKGSLNDRQVSVDAMVILNSANYVTQMEGEVDASIYGVYKVSALGKRFGDKFINVFQLTKDNQTHEMKALWKYNNVQQWDLEFEIYENSTKKVDIISGKILLQDVVSKPLRLSTTIETQLAKYSMEFSSISQNLPYVASFCWGFPGGAGNLKTKLTELSGEKVSSITILETDIPNEPHKQFTLTFDLNDHSPHADVNVDMDLGFSTLIGEDQNTITLNGTLRQVSSSPGLIALELKWPNSQPVVLKATAAYGESMGNDVITSLDVHLPNCMYGFTGNVTAKNENILISSTILWQKIGEDKEEINFNGNFLIKDKNIKANIDLTLPYINGKQTAVIIYNTSSNGTNIRGEIMFMEKEIEIEVKYNPTEGCASIKSSSFWDGNEATVKYKQSVSSERVVGIYSLSWPRYNNEKKVFEILLMEAKLNHNFLLFGHSGTIYITLPVENNNTLNLNYEFKFPAPDDVILKVHVHFGILDFGVEGSDILTKTDLFVARKTEVKLYNNIWPIAAAYIYQTYLHEEKIKEKLIIYQLKDTPDISKIKFLKESDSEGRKIHVDANFGAREIKYTTGYKYTQKIKSADVSLTWGINQGIIGEFSLQDKSQSALEDRRNIVVRLGNLIQLMQLEGQYIQNISGIHTTFFYDWNTYDEEDDLIEASIYLLNLSTKENRHFNWSVEINHETLEEPVFAEGEFERSQELPLSLKFLLHYSKSSAHDLHLDAYLTKYTNGRNISNLIIISHPSSNLYAEIRGNVALLFPRLNFNQNCIYTNSSNHSYSVRVIGEVDVMKKNVNSMINTTSHRLQLHFDPNENKSKIFASNGYNSSTWSNHLDFYSSLPAFVITLENLNANTSTDQLTSVETANDLWSAKKAVAVGGVEEKREIYFHVQHLQNSASTIEIVESWSKDVDMYFKLNHSRLLSSQVRWKKEIFRRIMGDYDIVTDGFRQSLINLMSHLFKKAFDESSVRIGPIVNDLAQTFAPFMEEFKNNSIKYRDSFVETYSSTKLTPTEQDYLASLKLLYDSTMKKILSLEIVKKLRTRINDGKVNKQITNFIRKITDTLQYLKENELSTEDIRKSMNAILLKLAQYYDNTVRELSNGLRNIYSDFQEKLHIWLQAKWHSVYYNYRPHILQTAHMIESGLFDMMEQISKTTESLRKAFKSVSYLSYLQKIYTTFYEKYKEFSERTLKENLEILCDYLYSKFIAGIKAFTDKVFPFMKDWIESISRAWEKLNKFSTIRIVSNFFSFIYNKTNNIISRLDIKDKILTMTAFLINHGNRIMSQTCIDAELRNIKVKTYMEWRPEKGIIKLEQKLPLTWKAFNQTPTWSKLFEIPIVTKIKAAFSATDYPLLDYWYKHININFSPWGMLPPFPAKAYFIGDNNIITFDGRHLSIEGDCEHLLAADLVHKHWAVTVKTGWYTPKCFHIYIYGKHVSLSMNYQVKIDKKIVGLPQQLGSTIIWRTTGSVHLRHVSGFEVSWNIAHDVLIVTVPPTSFLNTAGILGTNNNEPMDDLVSPEGKFYQIGEEQRFINTWNISSGKCLIKKLTLNMTSSNLCEDLFASKMSPYKHCFHHVNPKYYYDICLSEYRGKKENSCSISLAYRESCIEHNIPLKLPNFCVKCSYYNETMESKIHLNEGESMMLNRHRKFADVILMVELSSCNRKKLQSDLFSRFIKAFDEGLHKEGFASVRYSVAAFGGFLRGFQDATVVTIGPDLFVGPKVVSSLIKHLKFDKSDITRTGKTFSAINFVSKLNFAPSTIPTILLFSCSSCSAADKFDYSTMYHIIKSSDIKLVVFKDGYFNVTKKSIKKKIIGFNEYKAYTLKDSRRSNPGRNALQYQIDPPKKELGYCYPLATETGGSVFSSEFLKKSKRRSENLGLVVGRTLGLLPQDNSPEKCLCMSTEEVTPLMRCDHWKHGEYTILEKYGLDLDKYLLPDSYKQKDALERNFYVD